MRKNWRVAVAILPMALVGIVLVGVAHAPPALAGGKLSYFQETVTQEPRFSAGVQSEDLTTNIFCPAGEVAVEGGAETSGPDALMTKDEPFTGGANGTTPTGLFAHGLTRGVISWQGWSIMITDLGNGPLTYSVYVTCAAAGSSLGPITSATDIVYPSGGEDASPRLECSQGMQAISGGFATQGADGSITLESDTPSSASPVSGSMPDGPGWSLEFHNNNSTEDGVAQSTVAVIGVVECAAPTNGRLLLQSLPIPAQAGPSAVGGVSCPAGSEVLGGGSFAPRGSQSEVGANNQEQAAGVTELTPTEPPFTTGFEARVETTLPFTVTAVCFDPVSVVRRLSGATRIDTAVFTSADEYPAAGSASGAVVATGFGSFADALAGVPLAHKIGGPLLLTDTSSLDPATAAELLRAVAPGSTVYVLGGPAALDRSIDSAITVLGFTVVRTAGADRFQTAVKIASLGLGSPNTVFEATGLDFPDALAAGAAAAKVGGAILLTDGPLQGAATAGYLSAHPGMTTYAIGGAAAAADPAAIPLVGADRFATAVAVAQGFFANPASVGVASGLNFPDALSGGVDAALHGGPMLLTVDSGTLPPSTQAYLQAIGAGLTSAYLYGGTSTVGDDVASELDFSTGQDPAPSPPGAPPTGGSPATTTSVPFAPTTTNVPTTTSTTLFGRH